MGYPFGNGKIQSCDALSGNDYALGGESTHPTLNPDGWADMAVNLQSHAGKYVQMKFVMKHNSGTGAPENTTMPAGLSMISEWVTHFLSPDG